MTTPAPKLDKTYSPDEFEATIYQQWQSAGAFAPKGQGTPYTIMMPPPNVTGKLHMGHALNMTLQDIMIRYKRMKGFDVFWQAGTDHAGIATQAVVERELARTSNQTRQEIGRAAFEKKVWQWKERSGGEIVNQLKRLGASCDWSRARFTLDEGMNEAVRYAFVKLYEEGKIYRAERLVNWDVKLKTAISDLEVISREVKGSLWHLRYPLEEGSGDIASDIASDIIVATTRPETMLGDVAVAVHPNDERYRHLIGKKVRLPLTDRAIPIIADEYADPKQGSGAVKITPAHDFNDFEVGARHHLEPINILDESGKLLDTAAVPESYRGLSREKARAAIVAALEKINLLEKIETINHSVPYGDRSNEIIEPYLTKQWFVDTTALAAEALNVVERGETSFVPSYWQKTYFEWLTHIQPWCISRQLWWGHRIPAWFDEEGNFYVAMSEAQAQAQAGAGKTLTQDEDVLDTWFSSALWPFSTLGWRGGEKSATAELERYFPTQLLITGLDIIFFWVARMMMMSSYFMGKPPFSDIYIHALVRDEKGQKMTKSKGNVVDPLELMDRYGADALRFTMAAMAAQGQDIKLSTPRIEGYRNFATKIWNAARFCEMNEAVYDARFDITTTQDKINQWIVSELCGMKKGVDDYLEKYEFNHAADRAYHFVWGDFCDWYLELAKINLADESKRAETQKVIAFVLREILIVLHPFMPFITEQLWQEQTLLIETKDKTFAAPFALDGEVSALIQAIESIRSCRASLNVPPSAEIELFFANDRDKAALAPYQEHLMKRARVRFCDTPPPASAIALSVSAERTLYLDLGTSIDREAEKKRLQEQIAKRTKEIEKLGKKLNNKEFTAKAPSEVVAENQTRLAEQERSLDKAHAALKQLS